MKKNDAKSFLATILQGLFLSILAFSAGCDGAINAEPAEDVPTVNNNNPIVGRGYNLTDEYASRNALGDPVLDIEKLNNSGLFIVDRIEETQAVDHAASSSHSYKTQMYEYMKKKVKAKSSGGWGAFRASASFRSEFDRTFKSESSYNNKTHYASSQHHYFKKVERIKHRNNPETLKQYLNPIFKRDINDPNLPPSVIIERYGTHVLTAAQFGAKVLFIATADSESSSKKTSEYFRSYVKASAGASFAGVFGGGVGGEELKTSTKNFESHFNKSTRSFHIDSVGGRGEYVSHVSTEGTLASNSELNEYFLKKWVDSIHENPEFIEFYNDGFTGLWEFAETDHRKVEIKRAIQDYINAYNNQEQKITISVEEFDVSSDLPINNLQWAFIVGHPTAPEIIPNFFYADPSMHPWKAIKNNNLIPFEEETWAGLHYLAQGNEYGNFWKIPRGEHKWDFNNFKSAKTKAVNETQTIYLDTTTVSPSKVYLIVAVIITHQNAGVFMSDQNGLLYKRIEITGQDLKDMKEESSRIVSLEVEDDGIILTPGGAKQSISAKVGFQFQFN